jgi:hypothetical protein
MQGGRVEFHLIAQESCRMEPPALPATLANRTALLTGIESELKELIEGLDPAPPSHRGRGAPPVVPAMCLWAGMLLCVLQGFSSRLAIWRLLTVHGLWGRRFAVCSEAIYDRLDRATSAPLEQLFARLTALLHDRLTPYADLTLAPFATEVVALDETVLERLLKLLPAVGEHRGRALLPGRLATAFDVRRQQWIRGQMIADPHEREQLHARDLVSGIPANSLLLFDRGYFSFAWFDDLTHAGYWWISRMRKRTTVTVVHTFYKRKGISDQLVWLGAYRADQAGEMARMVVFPLDGSTQTYLTNVLDPHRLPLHEIARLYARRWDIELAFKLVKRELKLHLLWSSKPQVLAQQVWATLIIAQVLLALWVEIAGRAKVDVFDVSLTLLVQYAPLLAADGQDPVEVLVTRGRLGGFIRPSRRTINRAPTIPPTSIRPAPPDLVTSRPARYGTGQGSIAITPPRTLIFSPPPHLDIDPARRGRGTGGRT